eukprot:GHVQ01005031.1.p1 GENE.GHVQ01005031.1~~GHVQ01005031.1.p1  ORF type:complete len:322 (-),score=29.40 GHVQ01005031.1:1185-2150(-)
MKQLMLQPLQPWVVSSCSYFCSFPCGLAFLTAKVEQYSRLVQCRTEAFRNHNKNKRHHNILLSPNYMLNNHRKLPLSCYSRVHSSFPLVARPQYSCVHFSSVPSSGTSPLSAPRPQYNPTQRLPASSSCPIVPHSNPFPQAVTESSAASSSKIPPRSSFTYVRELRETQRRERAKRASVPLSESNNESEYLETLRQDTRRMGAVYDPPLTPGDPYPRHVRPWGLADSWSDDWTPYHPLGAFEKGQNNIENQSSVGYEVPYKFRVAELRVEERPPGYGIVKKLGRSAHDGYLYTDFVGNRYPTLDTAENYRYWKVMIYDIRS